ncbi:hypothetical protein NKCBBBOE_02787 [Pseudarthrobacter sp. MM222]|nr:hypothetical protein NKCBBBOE_02787 [Pseudarthrobacter sp. MM222]
MFDVRCSFPLNAFLKRGEGPPGADYWAEILKIMAGSRRPCKFCVSTHKM